VRGSGPTLEANFLNMLDVFNRLRAILSARERWRLYLQSAMLVGIAGLDMIGIASIVPFMAVVSNADAIHSNRWLSAAYTAFPFSSTRAFLFVLGMVVLALLICGNLVKALYTWLSLKYDNDLFYSLACRLLAHYMARPYQFFLTTNTAEMAKNVLAQCGIVVSGVLSPGMQVLANGALCVLIFALLLFVDPSVALAIVTILGGTYAAIYRGVRARLIAVGAEQISANFLKFRAAGEALSGIKDLKVLGREREFLNKFATHAASHARCNAAAGMLSQIPRYALETIAFGGILLIVLYSLKGEQQVANIVPMLSLYAFAGYRLMPALQQLFAGVSTVRVNIAALDMIYREIAEVGATTSAERILADKSSLRPLPFDHELRLHEVTFQYSSVQDPVVKKINLSLQRGTSIALVGSTGSGKTTLVDLILGLLTPTSGSIIVDGVELSGESVSRWQRNIGYVPQHIYLSDDSVAHNIAFGVPEREIDPDAVLRASRIARLHEFVENELPNRYDTIIGERGIRISGGQRQRIGLARALYHDPQVIVLDEATSALDGITEEAVMHAIRSVSAERTLIVVAHRLTTVRECDVIYHMEGGRITAKGTYEQLLQGSSWFQAASRAGTRSKDGSDTLMPVDRKKLQS
jgi:ABC-type multidrug transport system fused ATPase/permease subunit